MRFIAMVSVVMMAAGAVVADDSPLSQVADALTKIAAELNPVSSVVQDRRAVSLSYETRKFMVHNTDKLGRHWAKAHETVGPKTDGLIVQISLQDGRYFGAAKIPQNIHRPYWITYVNAYPIAKGKQHLHVNISYGGRTDRETVKKIKTLLDTMIDDAPENTKRQAVDSPH